MQWSFSTILFVFAFAGSPAGAEPGCAGNFLTAAEVVGCTQERSPEIQRARLELERARAEAGAAGQWKNPELSANSVSGEVNGEPASETDIALGIPIELGGKISARERAAKSRVARAEAEAFEAQARAQANVILKLHRLRQLWHEQEVIEETLKTFNSLVGTYGKRPKLSPEQELSVSVFRMAASDSIIKRSGIQIELSSLQSYFQGSLGVGLEALRRALPDSPPRWPEVGKSESASASPRMRQLSADLETARADLRLAQSESWPTLTLGPSVKLESENGRNDRRYGFNLSFPIPVFNANGAGRAAAAKGVGIAEAVRARGAQAELARREDWMRVYAESVRALKETLSHVSIEKEHARAERLLSRGVVPSSLVIESHRTFFELEKSRHETELKALEAFYEISIFDGKTPELFK